MSLFGVSVFHLLLFKDDVYCTYSDSIVARRGGVSIIIIIGHWSKPLSDVMIDYENCRTMKKLLLTNENIKTCVFKWTHNAAIIYWWPFSLTLFAFVVCWKQGTVAMLNLKMILSKKNSKDFNALTSEIFFIIISDWLVVSIQCCFWWKLPSVILWEFYYCRYKLICWCNSIIHRVNIVSALPVLAQNRFRNVFEFKGESCHI